LNNIPTLDEAFKEYLADRFDLKPGSIYAYENTYMRIDPEIAKKPLDQIKFSEMRRMYAQMFQRGLKPASIELLSNTINAVFVTAMQDDIIQKNPNQGALKMLSKGDGWKKTHRPALTKSQQKEFMDYIHYSDLYRRWENLFIFLFGTGCRIGETIGLRWENIDFDKELITIDHSVQYLKREFITGTPKTESSNRNIPMIPSVKEALKKEQQLAVLTQIEKDDNVPGKTGLIFRNHRGKMFHPSMINQTIKNIVSAYNTIHPDTPLPDFSVHQTRHTFATRLCENNINMKVIQSVMGHSDISTTMDIYAEVSDATKQSELLKLE